MGEALAQKWGLGSSLKMQLPQALLAGYVPGCCNDISINQSINQNVFFQAITKNDNVINATALERLPEKGGETNINTCNISASTDTSTYTINSKSSIHISWFLLHWVTNQQQF